MKEAIISDEEILRLVIFTIIIAILLATCQPASAKNEAHYQRKWCPPTKGETEVRMPNGTRADCLTKTHAVEVEFADKWLNSIGQSLNYAEQTGLRAGIVLVCKKPRDRRKLKMLRGLILFYKLPVDVWQINCDK